MRSAHLIIGNVYIIMNVGKFDHVSGRRKDGYL